MCELGNLWCATVNRLHVVQTKWVKSKRKSGVRWFPKTVLKPATAYQHGLYAPHYPVPTVIDDRDILLDFLAIE